MKSDHRHELKTNELADWIGHLPEWVHENRTTLIAAGAVVVVALGVYFAKFYRKDSATARRQVRLTSLVTQLPGQQERVATGLAQGLDQSITLLPIAEDLQDFAQTARSDPMAATALLERAEALRAELHYRLAEPSAEEIARQIALAQRSYREALERGAAVPTLAAAAQFGLGLCEEELGNFDKAREIYQQVATDAAYAGTVARAEAAHRLETMDDYRTTVVFKPAAKPAAAPTPRLDLAPDNILPPAVLQPAPDETNETASNAPVPGGEAAGGASEAQASDANGPAGN